MSSERDISWERALLRSSELIVSKKESGTVSTYLARISRYNSLISYAGYGEYYAGKGELNTLFMIPPIIEYGDKDNKTKIVNALSDEKDFRLKVLGDLGLKIGKNSAGLFKPSINCFIINNPDSFLFGKLCIVSTGIQDGIEEFASHLKNVNINLAPIEAH